MLGAFASSVALDVTSASVTSIGGRRANEDALGQLTARCGNCFVISDGAGGHLGGAIASRLVIETVLLEAQHADDFSASVLDRAFALAQGRLADRQGEDPALATMSATVAALLIDSAGRLAVWGHVGDSRILHFRRGTLRTVTHDHSLVQRLVDAGYVPPDRAAVHHSRNLLYAALGAEGETQPTIEREPVQLRDGDAFLLCTDGFWGRVEPERIEEQLRLSGNVDEWLETLRRLVAEDMQSGADNYSAIGVWIGSPEEVTVSRFARGTAKRAGSR
jgi:serine/threonine protein phosphatase PrpC